MTSNEKPFYLQQLEKTFENRIKMNPRYSLRAFARDLGISAPRLSGILNQKFGLSRISATELCSVLRYDLKTTEFFVTSVQAHHDRSPKAREVAKMKIANRRRIFEHLELDRFSIISDWYHFAIMELTRTMVLREQDSKKVAKSLGISNVEAKNAIERLLKLNLLKIENERLVNTGAYLVGNYAPSKAIRALNSQLIDKAKEAIHGQTVEERDLRTMTMAISKKSMPEFAKLFSEFQTKVRNLAEKEKQKTEVYAWTMQFYKLSETEKK